MCCVVIEGQSCVASGIWTNAFAQHDVKNWCYIGVRGGLGGCYLIGRAAPLHLGIRAPYRRPKHTHTHGCDTHRPRCVGHQSLGIVGELSAGLSLSATSETAHAQYNADSLPHLPLF